MLWVLFVRVCFFCFYAMLGQAIIFVDFSGMKYFLQKCFQNIRKLSCSPGPGTQDLFLQHTRYRLFFMTVKQRS